MYEINLVKQKTDPANTNYDYDYFMTYNWFEIPQVGDMIHIKESEVFIVEKRLLPSSEISDRVVLFGYTNFLFKNSVFTAKL